MCSKMGVDEIDSMKNIMGFAVCAVVAEVLDVAIEDLFLDAHFENDLGMSIAQQPVLEGAIATYFDGFQVNLYTVHTLQDLVNQIVEGQLGEIAA